LFEANDGPIELTFDGSGVAENEIELFRGARVVVTECEVDVLGFIAARAGETPGAGRDFASELGFDFADGFAVGRYIGAQFLEFCRVLAGDDGVGRRQAMAG
jgi:hypothetical protein